MKISQLFLYVSFCACIVFNACKKKDDPVPAPVAVKTTPALPAGDLPFLGVYENDSLVSITGDSMKYWDSGATEGISDYEFYVSDFSWTPQSYNLSITRGAITTNGVTLSDSAFKDLFTPGIYYYPRGNKLPNDTSGFSIDTHRNGISYSTANGPQTGNYVRILKSTPYINEYGEMGMRVVLEFNCKLYDSDGKLYRTLTHGIFRGVFRNYDFNK